MVKKVSDGAALSRKSENPKRKQVVAGKPAIDVRADAPHGAGADTPAKSPLHAAKGGFDNLPAVVCPQAESPERFPAIEPFSHVPPRRNHEQDALLIGELVQLLGGVSFVRDRNARTRPLEQLCGIPKFTCRQHPNACRAEFLSARVVCRTHLDGHARHLSVDAAQIVVAWARSRESSRIKGDKMCDTAGCGKHPLPEAGILLPGRPIEGGLTRAAYAEQVKKGFCPPVGQAGIPAHHECAEVLYELVGLRPVAVEPPRAAKAPQKTPNLFNQLCFFVHGGDSPPHPRSSLTAARVYVSIEIRDRAGKMSTLKWPRAIKSM